MNKWTTNPAFLKNRPKVKVQPAWNEKIAAVLERAGYHPVREYRFHPTRQFRFDLAFPKNMVAIEFQGGQFIAGRHGRPLGFGRDCVKFREAAVLGWRILHYTTKDLAHNGMYRIADDLRRAGIEPNKKAP